MTNTMIKQRNQYKGQPLVPSLIAQHRAYALSVYQSLPMPEQKNNNVLFPDQLPLTDDAAVPYFPCTQLAHGALVCDLRDFVFSHPTVAAQYLGDHKNRKWRTIKAAAFVETVFARAVVLFVPEGVSLQETVYLSVLRATPAIVMSEKLLIIVQKNAAVTVIDNRVLPTGTLPIGTSPTGASPTLFWSLECFVLEGASVTIIDDRQVCAQTNIVACVALYCSERSHCDYFVIYSDGAARTQWLDVVLQGRAARAMVTCFYLLDGKQNVSLTSRQEHCTRAATSTLALRGALAGTAHFSHTSTIFVSKDAAKTKAAQLHKSMILSTGARVRSTPELVVLNNDVRCSHGSAIGHVNKQQEFYLRTRGLTKKTARRLQLEAFLYAPITVLEKKEVQEYLVKKLNKKLVNML